MPLAHPAECVGRVKVYDLPCVETMASVVHEGPYNTLHHAYTALTTWMEANGYRIAGPNREVFLSRPMSPSDPTPCITEVEVPVQKTEDK